MKKGFVLLVKNNKIGTTINIGDNSNSKNKEVIKSIKGLIMKLYIYTIFDYHTVSSISYIELREERTSCSIDS